MGPFQERLQKDLSTDHCYIPEVNMGYMVVAGIDVPLPLYSSGCLRPPSKAIQAYFHLPSPTSCKPQGHLRCTSQYGFEHRLIHALWLDVKFEL